MNDSMLATDVADARGRRLAIVAILKPPNPNLKGETGTASVAESARGAYELDHTLKTGRGQLRVARKCRELWLEPGGVLRQKLPTVCHTTSRTIKTPIAIRVHRPIRFIVQPR